MNDEEGKRVFYEQLVENINRHGYTVQAIFDQTKMVPDWVYTIGLERSGLPEYAIVGMPRDEAAPVLHQLVQRCSNNFSPWPIHGSIVQNLPAVGQSMAAMAVDPDIAKAGSWFNVVYELRRSREELIVVQLVWSDKRGKWPKESTSKQILLGKPWWNDKNPYNQDDTPEDHE